MPWWGWLLIAILMFGLALEAGRGLRSLRRSYPVAEPRHAWWRWQWSQDGWIRRCKLCHAIQYGGEDYDGGPDVSGHVEARSDPGPRA